MKITLRNAISFSALFFAVLCLPVFCRIVPAAELAQIRDKKITTIQLPTLGAPAIVTQGDVFNILLHETDSDSIQGVWLASSEQPDSKVPLPKETKPGQTDLSRFSARVPPETAPGLYDLHIDVTDGGHDMQPHSVRVIDAYKSDFHFTIIADIHFGDSRGKEFTQDADFDTLRRNIIKSACGGGAEFVLVVGDLTNEPATYRTDYTNAWESFVDNCPAPAFMIPGNHDSYGRKDSKGAYLDGKEYWKAFFGPQYHYFDYGDMRFIGLDNHDWPLPFRVNIKLLQAAESINRGNLQEEQFSWLKTILADSQQQRLFVFAHLPFDKMRGGEPSQGKALPGVPKADILKLLKDSGVTHMFVGHMHHNEAREVGEMSQVMTNTAGSVLYDESQKWGYNTVFVKDGEITGVEYTEVDF